TGATTVLSNINGNGTLQLDNEDGTRAGFVVANELLTLNGNGFTGIGALDNFKGNNTWTGNVTLGAAFVGAARPQIGADSQGGVPTNLLLSGVLLDPTGVNPGFGFDKIGTGRLILTSANTFTFNQTLTPFYAVR